MSDKPSIRVSFVEAFGEENAVRVEESALGHLNEFKNALAKAGPLVAGLGDIPDPHESDNWGSDPFRYLFMLCISHECLTRFAAYHGFTMSAGDVIQWAREHADLHEHDGDPPDYFALLVGIYYPWIDWQKAGIEPPQAWIEFNANREFNAMPDANDIEHLHKEAADLLNVQHGKDPSEEEKK